jgi:hypothetical protein
MALDAEESIIALETTNANLVAAVVASSALAKASSDGLEARIAAAVEDSENESVLALIKMSENSIKTQTLFLTYINQ